MTTPLRLGSGLDEDVVLDSGLIFFKPGFNAHYALELGGVRLAPSIYTSICSILDPFAIFREASFEYNASSFLPGLRSQS